MKLNQELIVYDIVLLNPQGIRTEQVKIQAMYKGVSCADRYLRFLRDKEMVIKERKEGDRTDTWYPKGQGVMI